MSDRNGVPVSASRRVAGLERLQARLAPGLASHRRGGSRRGSPGSCAARTGCGAASGRTPTPAYVTATPWYSLLSGPRAVLRVELDPYPGGRLRPLLLQMLGRRDDGHLLHDVVVQQPRGEGQREGGLAGAGRRDGEEVARLLLDVLRPCAPCCQARSLPAVPQGARPGKAGERWWSGGGVVVTVSGSGLSGTWGAVRTGRDGLARRYDNRATLPGARPEPRTDAAVVRDR